MAALWRASSNNLVVLAVKDESELVDLYARLVSNQIGATLVQEPDYELAATAIACLPDPRLPDMLASLPLAGKAMAMN